MNTKEKIELIEKNMRLVIFIAQKYLNAGIETDDAISAGSLGLVKAANTFDFAKNVKFSAYAGRCIENEILMCVRSAKRRQREVSLYKPVSVDGDGGELLVMDILETGEDISKHAEDEAEIIILRNAIKKLSAKDQSAHTGFLRLPYIPCHLPASKTEGQTFHRYSWISNAIYW